MSDQSGDFRYPQWQKEVQEALKELDKNKLQAKVHSAESAIFKRLQEIAGDSDHHAERKAITEASTSLLYVQQEILNYPPLDTHT